MTARNPDDKFWYRVVLDMETGYQEAFAAFTREMPSDDDWIEYPFEGGRPVIWVSDE